MARLKYHQTILKILGDDHLTADDIYDIMKKKYGRIGIATIYRTLEHLIETKEITKLVGVFDKAYFERNKWPHMHFVDKQAYKIIDVPIGNYDFLPKQEWFSISYADIVVYGVAWNTVASGLFEKPNPPVEDVIVEQESLQDSPAVWQDEEALPPDPFFSMQDVASDSAVEAKNEEVDIVVDNVDIEEQDMGSSSSIEPSQANTSSQTIQEDVQVAPSQEELEKEEQKKKKRELKNIFRQF